MLTKLVEIHFTQVVNIQLLWRVDDCGGWIHETIPKFESDEVPHVLTDGHTLMLRVVLSGLLTQNRRIVKGGSHPAKASCILVSNCGRRRILYVVIIPRRIAVSHLLPLLSPPIRHRRPLLLQGDLNRGRPLLLFPLIAIYTDLWPSSIFARPVALDASNTTGGLGN
jgi:hypothetical protein